MKDNKEMAAAIQYDEQKDNAPVVIAKGQGLTAQKIKQVAEELKIPIYRDEKLVKQLMNLSVGQEIPPELYQVIAEILAFIIRVDTGKDMGYESKYD